MNPHLAFASLLAAALTAQASSTVLISDKFSATGPLSKSSPEVTVDGAVWDAITGPESAKSEGGPLAIPTRIPQTAVIDLGARYFAEHPGVYTLSMEFTIPGGGSPSWLGLGFVVNPQIAGTFAAPGEEAGLNAEGGPNGASPWVLLRQNGLASAFAGPGTKSPLAADTGDFASGSRHTLKLVLNANAANWTFDVYVDSTQLDLNGADDGQSATLAANPTGLRYVGFSQVGGDIGPIKATSFTLAVEGGGATSSAAPARPVAAPAHIASAGPGSYPIDQAHLLEPFWKSRSIHGEAVAFLKESADTPANGTLLFVPKGDLIVRSSDGRTTYEAGRDYKVDAANRRIVLTAGSRIPFIERSALYKKKGEKDSSPAKVGEAGTSLLYKEAWFRNVQAEVDYETDEAWNGYTPACDGSLLPKTLARLQKGEGLKICVTGDSISTGANASKSTPPFMPGYVNLVQRALEKYSGNQVTATNLSVPGTTAKGGLDKIAQVIAQKPDLVIIAFGMNDVAGHHPEQYAAQVSGMIDAVHTALPEAEFILVSSILANPEWTWSPAEQFPKYRAALLPLVRPGVALADMTALTTDLLQRKRYLDIAGNGINHPNDYTHRLYAEVILSLLLKGDRLTAGLR